MPVHEIPGAHVEDVLHATATFTKAGYLAYLSPTDIRDLLSLEASVLDILGTSSKDEKGKYRPLIGLFVVQYLQGHYCAEVLEKAFTHLDEGYCMSNKPHEIMGRMFRIAARMKLGFTEAILADIKKCDSGWVRGGDRLDIFYTKVFDAIKLATERLPAESRSAVLDRLSKCIDGMAKLKIRFNALGESFILHHQKATITGGPFTKLTNTVNVRVSVKLIEELMTYCYRLGITMGYTSIADLLSGCLVQGDDICDQLRNSGARFLWLKCADLVNLRFKASQSYGSNAIVFLQRLVYVYNLLLWRDGQLVQQKSTSICRMLPRLFQSFPFKRELLLAPMDSELLIKTLCSTFLKGVSRGMNMSELDLYIQAVADIYLGGNTVPINTNAMANGYGCGARDSLPAKQIAPERFTSSSLLPKLASNTLDHFKSASAYFDQIDRLFRNYELVVQPEVREYITRQATSKVRLNVQLDKSHVKAARDLWLSKVESKFKDDSGRLDPVGLKHIEQFVHTIWDPAITRRNAGEVVSFSDPDNPIQHFEEITKDSPFRDALILHYFVKALATRRGERRPTLSTFDALFEMSLLSRRGAKLLRMLIEATTPDGGTVKVLEKFGGAVQYEAHMQKGNKNMAYTLAPLIAAREFLGTGGNPFQPYIDEDQKVFELQFAQYVAWQLLSRHKDDILEQYTAWEVHKRRPLIAFSLLMRNVIRVLEDMRMGDCCVQGPMFFSKLMGTINVAHNHSDYLRDRSSRDDQVQLKGDKIIATGVEKVKFVGTPITFVRKISSSLGSDRIVKDGSTVAPKYLTMLKAYSNF